MASGKSFSDPASFEISSKSNALAASDLGTRRDVYKIGGWIKTPVWTSPHEASDPWGAFLYLRLGVKNHGWLPGEYLDGRMFAQAGLGLRL